MKQGQAGGQSYAALGTSTVLNHTQVALAWELVGTLPSDLQAWRLKTRDKTSFDYAYEADPTNYMTANDGQIEQTTAPAAIYVRAAAGKVVEFEGWS